MLARDFSCVRDLVWRCELPSDADIPAVVAALLARGWRDRSQAPFLRSLHSPDGHTLVVVPRTGRIQLRLSFVTPHGERQARAEAIHDELMTTAGSVRGQG